MGIRCQINADEFSAVGFRLGIYRIVIGAEQMLMAVASNQDIDAPYLLQHGIGTVVALHTAGAGTGLRIDFKAAVIDDDDIGGIFEMANGIDGILHGFDRIKETVAFDV